MKTWIGGPSDTAVPVTAWMEGGGASAQLGIATDDVLSDVVWGSSVNADIHDLVRMEATGLDPDTRYYWAVWEVGQLEPAAAVADFRTFPAPGTAKSYRFWAATCAGTGSDSSLVTGTVTNDTRISNSLFFDDIAASNADWGWNGGDAVYYNPGGTITPSIDTDVPGYVSQWTDVLQQTRQENLYQQIPLVYTWDDHDYGTDNSDKNQVGRENAQEAYRLVVPHHDLPDAEAIYQTWQHGRVFYIASDTRSYRDPNTDAQTASKTMLGGPQKTWMRSVLENAEANGAEFFVWLCPASAWWNDPVESGSDNDSWRNYPHERDEILGWLTDFGWLDRMLFITGDKHSLGIDSGANNAWGGFPYVQAAPIDANPSGTANGTFDRGWRGSERGHWARIDVTDDGDTIRLDIAGMVGPEAVLSHTITVDTTDPEPPEPEPEPPEPAPVPIGRAKLRTRMTWLGINDQTGRVIAELPDMDGDFGRLLTAYDSAKLTYPLVRTGPGGIPHESLMQATKPQSTSVVAVVNDLPTWSGRVLERVRGSDRDMILACSTPEQYLKNRQVTARTYTGIDRALLASVLLSDAGSTDFGSGMALDIDVTLTGDVIDREYLTSDMMNVYEALRALASGDLLEWTIDHQWANADMNQVIRVMRIASRIGRVGSAPVFATKGPSDCKYTLDENYTSDRYANTITVYGAGEGEALPVSETVFDPAILNSGTPIVHKVLYARDTTDPAELTEIARAELARRKWGAELWTLDALINAYPRLTFDAGLGDDIAWDLTGPGHPYGVKGAGRMIGWTCNARNGRWKPKLIDPHVEEVF